MEFSYCKDIYNFLCKKHPNKKIFLIGDHHFYHFNLINYTRTEFADINEMNSFIIKKHNEIVNPEDIVIFLGDFSFKKANIKEILDKMNGHKYLILGNHDSEKIIKQYPEFGFECVFKNTIKIQENYISHEPLTPGEKENYHFNLIVREFKKQVKSINYHGHIHEKDYIISERHKNMAAEVIEYKPHYLGSTTSLQIEDKPLFINSPYIDDIINKLQKDFGFDTNILLEDYIYSYMLESTTNFKNNYFIQGSYALLKKYGFISQMSDIDISFLFNPELSKNKNISELKTMVDNCYKYLQNIDKIDLSFYKRYSSIRIFEALLTSKSAFAKCHLDANLIFLDCYKESDFITLEYKSIIENLINKTNSSIIQDYQFPSFKSRFLVPEGDLANSILQLLFQQGFENKKSIILKKLNYIYEHSLKNKELYNLQDLLIRFYLRNIALLHTLHRFEEIKYLQENPLKFKYNTIPNLLLEQVRYIVENPTSQFVEIHKEMSKIDTEASFEKCNELIKKLR